MRSGISFFNWTAFKKTVFRFWPLWGAYFALWLVALPMNGLMALRSANYDWYGGSMEYFSFYRVPETVPDDGMTIFVVFGVLAAMAVFSHLYNPRSANLFGSLPIRREGLFLTHYLAGLAFLIVPNAVIFLLTLAVEAAGGCVCMEGLLFWLAVSCGESFFFYSLAVFCAMFTGHILALPAFYAIVNGLVMGITGLVFIVFQAFYHGFAGFPGWVGTVIKWFTPVARLSESVECWTGENDTGLVLEVQGLGTVGIYAIVAVALAACAFLLYRRRRLESAGDVVAVNAMKPVFKYGVALCAGVALGMGTLMMIGGGEGVALMIAIVIWGIVGYFAAEMLLQKSFKVFQKWKGAAAVTAVFVVLFLVVGFDLTGYETRIPDLDDVESVTVTGLNIQFLDDDGNAFRRMTVTDPEVIRLITLVHKAAVEQRDVDGRGGPDTTTTLSVTYHLKNGGALSRQYHWIWVQPEQVNQEGTAPWAVQQLYNNRELCWRMYGFDELEGYLARGGGLTQAGYDFYDEEGLINTAYFYGGDAEALFAAMKEDFFAGRVGARRVTADADQWSYHPSDEYLHFISDSPGVGGGVSYYITIAVSDTATSTRAALEKLAPAAEQNGAWYGGEYSGEITVEPVGIFG